MHPEGDTAEAHQTDRPGQDFFDHGYKTPRDDGTTTDGRRVNLAAGATCEINAGLTFFSSWQWNHLPLRRVNDQKCIFEVVAALRNYTKIVKVICI
jgi:hypothetical protein